MFRAILTAAFFFPVIIFLGTLVTGLIFELAGWYGSGNSQSIFYSGALYSFIALMIITVPTLVFGVPAMLLYRKYANWNRAIIVRNWMLVAAILSGIMAAFFLQLDHVWEVFLWAVSGGFCGALNAIIFCRKMEHYK